MKKSAVFFITLLLLLGCFVSAGAAEDAAHTEATVFAKCGEVIQISAVGNPTTGYVWSEPKTSNGLKLLYSDYTQLKPGMIGTGGIFEWGVIADTPGFYLFKTEYSRNFLLESGYPAEPAKTLKALFVYLPDFMEGPSGVISLRTT